MDNTNLLIAGSGGALLMIGLQPFIGPMAFFVVVGVALLSTGTTCYHTRKLQEGEERKRRSPERGYDDGTEMQAYAALLLRSSEEKQKTLVGGNHD